MRKLFYVISVFLVASCGSKSQQHTNKDSKLQQCAKVEDDPLTQYRDTLIGRFNGIYIDTLICEPIDSIASFEDEHYGGYHYKWRVYTKSNTVKELIIENTVGIHFINEGDLDGNGTEEWGYVTQWPTSNWMLYHAFSVTNGEWKPLIEPTSIFLSHIDMSEKSDGTITYNEIAQPSGKANYVNIKFSDVRNNSEDFLLVDTLIQVKPQSIR